MADTRLPGIIEHLRSAVATRDSPGVADAQLLERFAVERDEAAFELLVWRHSKMVLGTCRRVLRDAHEAEDAFQACFLVLARRAGSIGRRESVAGWLHKVALRLALAARAGRAKREAREQSLAGRAPGVGPADPALEAEQQEARLVIDDEVGRLPDKFRVPFVLCCLEGRSSAEVARELGCPLGTVDSRLARARERLCERLSRRGVALSAGLFAALLAGGSAPGTLVASTAKAALASAPQALAAGLISTNVAALTEGVLRAMWMTKLKAVSGVVLAVALAGAGAGAFTYGVVADGPPAAVGAKEESKIAGLIERLGSDSFAEREKASKDLEEVGIAALAALRKAAKSDDPERRKRANDLLKKIEVVAEREEALKPKRLRLIYKDTPLTDAVADFKKKSGYDIALSDPQSKLKGRTVTLDTGEVTFWQALGQFCQKSGLVEVEVALRPAVGAGGGGMMGGMGMPAAGAPGMVAPGLRPGGAGAAAAPGGLPGTGVRPGAAPAAGGGPAPGAAPPPGAPAPGGVGGGGGLGGAPGMGGGRGFPGMPGLGGMGGAGFPGGMAAGGMTGAPIVNSAQILLADGKPKGLPTDDATAARVRALDKADAPGKPVEGELLLPIEVSLEPKLRWRQLVTAQVKKALDDQGQSLEQTAPAIGPAPAGIGGAMPAIGGAAGGMAVPGMPAGAGAGVLRGRAVGVGGIAGWANLGSDGRPRLATLRLKKGMKAAKSLKELSGTVTAHVLGEAKALVIVSDVLKSTGKKVTGDEGGAIHVVTTGKEPNGRFTLHCEVESPAGALAWATLSEGRILLSEAAGPGSVQHDLTLVDADGNLLPPAGIRVTTPNARGAVGFVLVYLPRKGQGEPARLSLRASKSITVEIPFTLKDVPLP